MAVVHQVVLQVGSPGAGPVGENASGIVIELVPAVVGTVGQGGGVNPALAVAFGQAGQRSLHGGLGEAVHPHAFFILVEGGIRILIELRQVVHKGGFHTNEASGGQRVGILGAVAIGVLVYKGVAHGSVFIPGGGSFHAHGIQPGLLYIGNAAAATGIRKAVQPSANLQPFDDIIAVKRPLFLVALFSQASVMSHSTPSEA